MCSDVNCELAGSKIIFTNGSQDPWRHASKQTSSTDSECYWSDENFVMPIVLMQHKYF